MQAENGALQGLVVDLAANKTEAKQRLEDLKGKYQHLLQVPAQNISACKAYSLPSRRAQCLCQAYYFSAVGLL